MIDQHVQGHDQCASAKPLRAIYNLFQLRTSNSFHHAKIPWLTLNSTINKLQQRYVTAVP